MTEESAALYVVATPLGNFADLTRRAEEILRSVPWVAAEDTRHSGPLLKQLGSPARMLPAHRHNEHEAAARIVDRLNAGGFATPCSRHRYRRQFGNHGVPSRQT